MFLKSVDKCSYKVREHLHYSCTFSIFLYGFPHVTNSLLDDTRTSMLTGVTAYVDKRGKIPFYPKLECATTFWGTSSKLR